MVKTGNIEIQQTGNLFKDWKKVEKGVVRTQNKFVVSRRDKRLSGGSHEGAPETDRGAKKSLKSP